MNKQSPLTIGVLAKQANVGVETIRFYERKGLITQPPKTGGFRHYSEDDVKRIRLVKKLQEIGFTLEEIKEFLLYDHCCNDSRQVIKRKSQEKIAQIQQQIAGLQTALEALEKFSTSCGTDNDNHLECELLDCFDNQWACCAKTESS